MKYVLEFATGAEMKAALDILEGGAESERPKQVHIVNQMAGSFMVIATADDLENPEAIFLNVCARTREVPEGAVTVRQGETLRVV